MHKLLKLNPWLSLNNLHHYFLLSYKLTVLPLSVPILYPLVQVCHHYIDITYLVQVVIKLLQTFQIAQHGSVCTTLAVATERFLSVCRPER